jgi:hypothetical protein
VIRYEKYGSKGKLNSEKYGKYEGKACSILKISQKYGRNPC